MQYILDLFTPETWQKFLESEARVTGFRERYRRLVRERVRQGDTFVCYLTRLSRWCGVLRVRSDSYHDTRPIYSDPDPYVMRFNVEPIVLLDPESAIPIYHDDVWTNLSLTKRHEKGQSGWTGFFRNSLNLFDEGDGKFLVALLEQQQSHPKDYPLSDRERRHLTRTGTVRAPDRVVEVEIPEGDDIVLAGLPGPSGIASTDGRESIRVQAKVAEIGAEMGFQIWVPRNDRSRVLEHVPTGIRDRFLDILPLNYDENTLRTIEQIDVLWLKRRSMARAFEIEHTTAIYSGLLRMADLLALQPNMDIRLHIVAPDDRRDSVLREIRRPVFSLLDRGPLYEQCSFLSYDSVNALSEVEYLSHMSDSVISEYEDFAEV